MAITNWSDPIDSAKYDEVMKNKPKIVLIKIFCFFLATCRNVVAAYVTNLWVFAGGDKAAYIAHRVLVMLTWYFLLDLVFK
ncbi:hypothetical protein HK099_002587 [Clydaea vesicula]|uniref:Uncharacterized protein n=1 Tax=Clydaea vesicula TaxID=447962 RepID=A0AAD5U5G7_9FUNG|nr:hypothetical protein HK099_002587 [Clydaea vesicula]